MKLVIFLIAGVALVCGLAIALAAPGAGWGLWDFGKAFDIYGKLAPREALFGVIDAWPVRGAAALAALAGVVALMQGAPRLAMLAILSAGVAFGSSMIPLKMRALVASNPFIHDITTDFENPPQIIAAADAPRSNPPEYLGDDPAPRSEFTVAESQRDAFPDIGPIRTPLSVEDAASRARTILNDMGMEILFDGPIENNGWRIEAAYTSRWFRFIDDFVVRVTPDENGAVVNIRSKSRVGGSDLGANAARVREFIERFESAA